MRILEERPRRRRRMPWYQNETDEGVSDWVEVPMNRFIFTIHFAWAMMLLLGYLAGKIRDTLPFGLLVAPPIIVFSILSGWWIGSWFWPDRPAQGSPGFQEP